MIAPMLRGLRQGRTGFAQVLAAMALFAIAFRAIVPVGYMVGTSDNGRLMSIVLCSGHEAILNIDTGQLVADTPLKDRGSERNSDAPCVFAIAGQLAAPGDGPELPSLVEVHAAQIKLSRDLTPGRGLAAPPPWSTGPPLTA